MKANPHQSLYTQPLQSNNTYERQIIQNQFHRVPLKPNSPQPSYRGSSPAISPRGVNFNYHNAPRNTSINRTNFVTSTRYWSYNMLYHCKISVCFLNFLLSLRYYLEFITDYVTCQPQSTTPLVLHLRSPRKIIASKAVCLRTRPTAYPPHQTPGNHLQPTRRLGASCRVLGHFLPRSRTTQKRNTSRVPSLRADLSWGSTNQKGLRIDRQMCHLEITRL